jgi:hypothetical protein
MHTLSPLFASVYKFMQIKQSSGGRYGGAAARRAICIT